MKTLSDIQSEINKTIESLGMEGEINNLLGNLLSYSIYLNEVNSTSTVIESSPVRCLNLNSAIIHAQGKGYNVFRGSNQKINLWDKEIKDDEESDEKTGVLVINTDYSVKKYDVAIEVGGVKLVYAQDYNFWVGESNKDTSLPFYVTLIATRSIETKTITIDETLKTRILIPESNISQDLVIYNSSGTELNWTSNYSEFLKNPSLILVLTDSDYGISLFNINGFKIGDSITIKWLPYTDIQVDVDSIKVIDQFELPENINSYAELINGNIEVPLQKTTDKQLINLMATNCFLGNFQLRTNSDLRYIIKSYFIEYFNEVEVIYNYSENPSVDNITVNYILIDGVDDSNLDSLIEQFEIEAKTSYNILSNFEFVNVGLNGTTCNINNLKIEIFYSGDNPQFTVNNIISDWESRINEKFNVFQFIADIQSTGLVNYTQLKKDESTGEVIFPVIEPDYPESIPFKLKFNEPQITYTYQIK